MNLEAIFNIINYNAPDNDISYAHKKILNGQANVASDESIIALYSNYLEEIWISESPPNNINYDDGTTINIMDNCIETIVSKKYSEYDDIYKVCNKELIKHNVKSQQITKLTNLIMACIHLFGNKFDNVCKEPLSISLIKQIHEIVSVNLVLPDENGRFRQRQVRAKNSIITYAHHTTIEHKLNTLVNYINTKMENLDPLNFDDFKSAIKLGCIFFSEFLYIHPFADCNGRTARLLLNYILKDFAIIPFSLFKNRKKDEYYSLLEERIGCNAQPKLLNKLLNHIMNCVIMTAGQYDFLLS